jgi:hypothetical protein
VAFRNARAEGALSEDTARARGSYDILIESTTFNETAFEPVGSGQPFYQAAITEMRYSASVDGGDARFSIENATVVPHRNDPGGILRQHPRVERFDITDQTSDGDPTFDVDWEVRDEDGDLARVELYLVHKDDDAVVDSAEYNVSGHAAGGEDTLDTGVTTDMSGVELEMTWDARTPLTEELELSVAAGYQDCDGRCTYLYHRASVTGTSPLTLDTGELDLGIEDADGENSLWVTVDNPSPSPGPLHYEVEHPQEFHVAGTVTTTAS